MEANKPARLDALTGLRCFAALNIVFFHFSNPLWFGPLAPVVNAGYISVSFFIMLSGFVLAYNYAERARQGKLDRVRFWKARWTRLYPVYLLSLILGWQMIAAEYRAHTHPMFWTGIVLTPLLLQGWVPALATFWNTPAWTMSAESFYYLIFPWLVSRPKPVSRRGYLLRLSALWLAGLIPGVLYVLLSPDNIAAPNRFSYGPWLQALKFTPLPHLPSFLFGVMLAGLDEEIARESSLRLWLGLAGFVALYCTLLQAPRLPYAMLHDGLLMPLFGAIILGLAGRNWLSRALGIAPLVFVGEASYCLYLLHFNLWNMLHRSGLLPALGLTRFDPWISYAVLIAFALLTLHLVEKPAQRLLRHFMNA
uniref:Putative Acyltransferase family protein n=1 Tax=mine drainage metagenome TaxID=410659 RepID=E6PYD3_9ZZZZ